MPSKPDHGLLSPFQKSANSKTKPQGLGQELHSDTETLLGVLFYNRKGVIKGESWARPSVSIFCLNMYGTGGIPMDSKALLEKVQSDNVRFISLQFTDVIGAVKSVDIPAPRLASVLDDGIWFDGSSVAGFARIQESDMRLKVDTDTYCVLPWSPDDMRRARLFCDIHTADDVPFAGDPRGILKRSLAKIAKKGWTLNVGAEPEFFLFKRNGKSDVHPVPYDVGGYFEFSANDDAVLVRTELMDALVAMGLDVEMGHHEVALGQHEIDFRFSDALQAADHILTLKYTVKAIAAKHGLVASFMPKPIFGISGSGMHCHQSLFDEND